MAVFTKNLYASKNIRLFKNPILETFTYVHPAVPILIFGPTVMYLFIFGTELSVLFRFLAVAAGLLVWTVTEYTLHRFVFHYEPSTAQGERLVYLFHGIHHDDPEDARRLVMPPLVSIVLASLFYFLFQWLFVQIWGEDVSALWLAPFFAGFLAGYLCYDYIHFWIHFGTPRSAVGKFLKQYHMLHHFVTPNQRYGVSSPLIDYIVGTDASKPLASRAPHSKH